MPRGELVLRYDGLGAETEHMIDMRRLGNALVGLDKIITTGLIVVAEGRIPRRNERLPFRVVAGEPTANCVSVLAGVVTGAQQSFPFAMSVIQTGAADLIWNWVSYVFKVLGGRMKEADPHFERLMELTKEMHQGDLQDREKMREFFLQVLDRIKPSAAAITAPVGESSNSVSFVEPKSGDATTLGIPMAEAVRSKEVLEVGDMREMKIRIDGITKHTRRASVISADQPDKFLPAEVRDPAFDQTPNIYTQALADDLEITVQATPTYRGEELYRLYIMGAAAG
jgi:hypothetical protein